MKEENRMGYVSNDDVIKKQIILLLNEMGIDVDDYRYDDKEEQI